MGMNITLKFTRSMIKKYSYLACPCLIDIALRNAGYPHISEWGGALMNITTIEKHRTSDTERLARIVMFPDDSKPFEFTLKLPKKFLKAKK